MTTPGQVTDYAFVQAALVEDAQRFNLQDLALDRLFQGQQVATELAEAGLTVFPMGQGFLSMALPTKELGRLVLGRKLHHGANPILRWMADNLVLRKDPAGNEKPDKERSAQKIDGIVALVMALDRASRTGGQVVSKYETANLLVL
jgi:phage terminase large subunit-like protein